MKLSDHFSNATTRLSIYFWGFLAAWTIVIAGLFILDILQIQNTQRETAMKEAVSIFKKDQATRFWAASHGGVYVYATEQTPPNPYLSHIPERDIKTHGGKTLTLMNPAYMLRQMMEEYENLYGVRGHITSLKYFRPETAPDEWEKSALNKFEQDARNLSEIVEIDGISYLRLMSPMIAKKGCLKCHGHQGYKVGDIRGGVSVSVPMTPYLAIQQEQITTHGISLGVLWFLGLAGISLGTRSLRRRIRERDIAEAKLRKAHDELELRVVERTSALSEANENLQVEIRERRKVEEELRVSEERFKELFNNMNDGVAVYKAVHDGEDFIFTDLNRAGEKIDGVNRDELIDRSILEIFPGIKDFGLFDVFQKVWKTGKPEHHPVSFYKDKKISGWRENYIYKLPSGEIVAVYDDVTEQMKTRKRFELLIKNLPAVVFRGFKDFSIEFIDEKIEHLTGYEADEFNSKRMKWSDVILEEDIETAKEKFISALKGDRFYIRQYRIRTRAGNIIWLSERGQIICDERGEIEHVDGVFFDITDRKRDEEIINESESRLRDILNAVQAGVIMIDAETHVICDANPAAAEMIGAPKEEIIGNVCHQYLCPTEKGKCPIIDLGQTFDNTERVLLTANGEHLTIIKTVVPIVVKGRKYLLGSFTNISDLKKAREAALKESAKLSGMISGMEEGVIFAEADGIISEVNEFFCRFTGVERENILGRHIAEFHTGETWDRVSEYIRQFQENPRMNPIQVRKSIGNSECLLRAQPINNDGKYDGVLLNVIDITDLTRAQRKAEAANLAKSEFLANMRHRSNQTAARIPENGEDLSRFPAFNYK
ncbi:MAG: PAS domain S-box protein [Deltaproteobacteria bacterium]|nr:PAS domain S-box protein [Deltaproteobacteria bacterium]